MRRPLASLAALALLAGGLGLPAPTAQAAPLPAPYAGSAGGDVLAVDLDVVGGVDLADARIAVSRSEADGGATPTSTASGSNLAATVAGLGIGVVSNTQTAPADNPAAETDTLVSADAPGLLNLDALTTTVQARTEAAVACRPGGGVLATSEVESAGATLDPTDVGPVVDTGDASTTGVVALVPSPAGDPRNRAVRSTATGTLSATSLLGGDVVVSVEESTLRATATGEPGGAAVTYDPGTVRVTNTTTGTTTTLEVGDTTTLDVPGGRVVLTVNPLAGETESADGRTASGAVSVVTAEVRVGPAGAPTATATLDLLPLRAEAVSPAGGIDCPAPPTLVTPADGSSTFDRTPTFTGTADPGAEVEIVVDGEVIGTVTAGPDGRFSFTPDTPLDPGDYTATAVQTTVTGIVQESTANDFAILATPTLRTPADGSTTDDTTPTFTGTAPPGSTVAITVDGEVIGTTTADPDGRFSFTPTTPLAPGDYRASVTATLEGLRSPRSNVNDFTVREVPAAGPVITSPADGSTTTDATPVIRGTGEPGASVTVSIDGTEIGTVVVGADGTFALPVRDPLPPGDYTVSATQTLPDGTTADADDVTFTVAAEREPEPGPGPGPGDDGDGNDAPSVPVITSPADGSTTDDPGVVVDGTADPLSRVILLLNGREVGSTVADENGSFQFALGDLAPGEYTLEAVAVDADGNRSPVSDPVTFTVAGSAGDGLPDRLADTGGPAPWLAAAGLACLLGGVGVLAYGRRLGRRTP